MEFEGRSARGVAVFVRFGATSAPGALHVVVEPVEDDRVLTAADVLLLLQVWRDGDDVVRGALTHPESRRVAYFQGNGALEDFARAIGLRLARTGMTS